jgi:hypothetical protein
LQARKEPKPRRFVLLEVDQWLGEPLCVLALVQSSYQRGAVGVGSGERVEEFANAEPTSASERLTSVARFFLTTPTT